MAPARSIAVVLAAAGVAAGYVLCPALHLPMVWLDSATVTWSAGARPSTAAMDFFGKALWAAALGATLAAIAAAAFRRGASARAVRVAVIAGAAVIAVAFGLEVKRLAGRVPVSEELPSGYDPVTGRVVEQPARLVHR